MATSAQEETEGLLTNMTDSRFPAAPSHPAPPLVQRYEAQRAGAARPPAPPAAVPVAQAVPAGSPVQQHGQGVVHSVVAQPADAYPILGAENGHSASGSAQGGTAPARAPVRAELAEAHLTPPAGKVLKAEVVRALEEPGSGAGAESARREQDGAQPFDVPVHEANRIARQQERSERHRERVASHVARQRDREEVAAFRAGSRAAQSDDRRGLFVDAQGYPLDSLPAGDLERIYGVRGAPSESEEKKRAEEQEIEDLTKQKGGYQISDYRSEYDTSGGYEIPEYKSIYD